MKIKSVKFNFIMNFILTASSVIFPLLTAPYIFRVLLPVGNGRVAFAESTITLFMTVAALGIPTYGIRACAKVRDDKEKLSKTVQELLIINGVTTGLTYLAFIGMLLWVPAFKEESTLLFIISIGMLLNVVGVNWLYSALEQYAYITVRTLVFRVISIAMIFLWVRKPEDYILYAVINLFAGSGANILNFLNIRKFVSLKKQGKYDFRPHLKPIMVFFATSAAISIYINLDVTLLKLLSGSEETGQYAAAIKIKTILVSLVTSLGTVLLPRLSHYYEKGKLEEFRKRIGQAFNFVFLIAAPLSIYFMLFASEAVLFVSGGDYVGAIRPMIIMMPTVFFIGLSNVTGIQMLTPMNQEKKVLISIICGAGIDLVLNILLDAKMGATGAAIAVLSAEFAVLLVQCVYLRKDLKACVKEVSARKILVALGMSVVAVVVLKMVVELQIFVMLCVSAMVFFGVYGGMLLVQRERFVWGMVENLRKRLGWG